MSGYQIQRLTFSGMLDQSFRVLRDHFVAMTVPFIVLYIPYSIALEAIGLDKVGADFTLLLAKLGQMLGVITVFMIGAVYAQLVVTNVIADCYLGRPISTGDALKRALRAYMPYLGTSILVTLALIIPFLLLILPGIYLAVCWMLIGPIVVVEKAYGWTAMKRSWALIKGHFWEAVAVMLVTSLLVSFASGGLGLLFKFIPVVGPVLTGIVEAVTASYMSVVIVVLYVDLRCRHEDFDLQLLAQQIAGGGADAALPVAPAASNSSDAAAG